MNLWWKRKPVDGDALRRAVKQRQEAEALARRLAEHRRENHFGEKFHNALRLKEGH